MTESFKYLTDQMTFIFIIEQCHDPIELYSLQRHNEMMFQTAKSN